LNLSITPSKSIFSLYYLKSDKNIIAWVFTNHPDAPDIAFTAARLTFAQVREIATFLEELPSFPT